MSSTPKKSRDVKVFGSARPENEPVVQSANGPGPPAENCGTDSRSRPTWQPAPGREGDAGLTAMLQLYLDEYYSSDATWRHRLVEVLLQEADEGNMRAIQEIWNRLEGKPGGVDGEDAQPPNIDAEVASKILEAGCTDDEDPPVD